MIEIIKVRHDNLVWSDDGPSVLVQEGDYKRSVRVDPYPCYPHEKLIVEDIAARVASLFPLYAVDQVRITERRRIEPRFYLTEFECSDRFNGRCTNGHSYGDGPRGWTTTSIMLHGKRVPPMPAMTRYLVAHEYGHGVECAIENRDARGSEHRFAILKEYAKRRGMADGDENTSPWHVQPAEVFANDFRVLICGVELEYWPHVGVTRPEDVPGLRDWWEEQAVYARGLSASNEGR